MEIFSHSGLSWETRPETRSMGRTAFRGNINTTSQAMSEFGGKNLSVLFGKGWCFGFTRAHAIFDLGI